MAVTQWPKDLQPLVADLWADIVRSSNARVEREAKADPKKYKLTRVFAESMSYRYLNGGKDGRGRRVRFCWSCHRNVAGYFLGWREVIGKKESKRDQWIARKVRRRVQDIAERRQVAFSKRGSVPCGTLEGTVTRNFCGGSGRLVPENNVTPRALV